jgi:hypothetical protein
MYSKSGFNIGLLVDCRLLHTRWTHAGTETHSHVKVNPNGAFEIFPVSAAGRVIYFPFIPEV